MTDYLVTSTSVEEDHLGRPVSSLEVTSASTQTWRIRTIWDFVGLRIEPVGIEIHSVDGKPLSSTHIRELPLGTLMQISYEALSTAVKPQVTPGIVVPTTDQTPQETMIENHRRGRPPVSKEQLQVAAEAYKAAYHARTSVTQAVAEACQLTLSTAGKWIMRARQAGLLDGYEVKR